MVRIFDFMFLLPTGPGVGIPFVLSREQISLCFSSSGTMTAAFSICHTGSPFAYVVITPLSQLFLDTYGWRGTLLLLGAIFFHMTVCGALIHRPSDKEGSVSMEVAGYVPLADDTKGLDQEEEKNHPIKSAVRATCQNLHTELFCDLSYWLVALIIIIIQFGNTAWLVYFVPHMEAKGFSPSDAVTFTVVVGLGRLFAGLVLGPLSGKVQLFDSGVFMGITLALVGAYYVLNPLLTSYWLIVANQAVYGCSIGLAWLFYDVILYETVGMDRFASAMGWIALKCGISRVLFLYLPGK